MVSPGNPAPQFDWGRAPFLSSLLKKKSWDKICENKMFISSCVFFFLKEKVFFFHGYWAQVSCSSELLCRSASTVKAKSFLFPFPLRCFPSFDVFFFCHHWYLQGGEALQQPVFRGSCQYQGWDKKTPTHTHTHTHTHTNTHTHKHTHKHKLSVCRVLV